MKINNKEIAEYYHKLDFNICCISEEKTDFNKSARNILKCPVGPWKHFRFERQSLEELLENNWSISSGMGVVLGYNNLRAIDVDETAGAETEFIQLCLEYLKLPKDYEWVVKSGSGKGFHILFYADDENWKDQLKVRNAILKNEINLSNLHPDYDLNIVAFGPALGAGYQHGYGPGKWEKLAMEEHAGTLHFKNSIFDKATILPFKRFELRSEGFLVLPPSKHSHSEFSKYEFMNLSFPDIIPKSLPSKVERDDIIELIKYACVYTKFTLGS